MYAPFRHLVTLTIVVSAANMLPIIPAKAESARAIFAGGCFWCLEKDLEHVAGVKSVVSGYTDGKGASHQVPCRCFFPFPVPQRRSVCTQRDRELC